MTILAFLALAACASGPERAAVLPAEQFGGTPLVTATGQFEGRGGHVAAGTGEIARLGKDWVVILADDFHLDDATDAEVALGPQGSRKPARIAPLARNAGRQIIPIPRTVDVGDYFEIWIWSERAGAPIAVAPLRLT